MKMNKIMISLMAVAVILVAVVVMMFVRGCQTSTVALEVEQKIDNTPISIERLRQIGQWEFLSVADEELVDTTRKRFFGDDELIRIYYGELRLGIDMRDMAEGAITTIGDSVSILLPEVKLLDENFIDEARTKSFYETGSWSDKDREALYQKAKRQMKQHCMTKENMASARDNAISQMEKMLKTLGVEKVNIR